MKKLVSLILAVAFVLSLTAVMAAESFAAEEAFKPSYKTLNIMVPFKAGGTVDLYARLVAKYAPQYTDINMVITNMEGSSGMVGAMEVLAHDPDGSWMMATAPSTSWISTADRKLPYTMQDNWVAVCALYTAPQVLLAKADNANYDDFDSFIEYSKANPGKINVGLSGASGNPYYYSLMTNEEFGLENTPVAFDGESDAMTNLLGGHVDVIVCGVSTAATQVNNGEAKALLVYANDPSDSLPGIKCMSDYSFPYRLDANRGFAMEKGTDEKILQYWSDIIGQMCQNPDFIAESEALGLPIQFYDTTAATELWYKVIDSTAEVMEKYQ